MDKNTFLSRLEKLVSIKTYSGNDKANSVALDLVESWVGDGVKKTRVKNGDAEILLLGNGNLLKPKIGYLVHMDVVSASDELFKLRQLENKLIGRGVSDMKFSIPIGVEVLNMLLNTETGVDFTLAITTDEEMGGGDGGSYLAKVMEFRPEVLFVPDGGDNFVLINKSKGVVHIEVSSKGVSAHASEPWLGKNALAPLCLLASDLTKKYSVNDKKPNWDTTMNIGYLKGGSSTNQVCDEAVMKLDFRFPEDRSVHEIHEEVTRMAKLIDESLEVKIAAFGDPTYTDENSDVVKMFLKISEGVLGFMPKVEGECGASDARFWSQYQTPTILIKPDGGDIHGDTEWVDLNSCLKFFDIVWSFVQTLET